MGFFDFLKPRKRRAAPQQALSPAHQQELLAFALMLYEQNGGDYAAVARGLDSQNLSPEQHEAVMAGLRRWNASAAGQQPEASGPGEIVDIKFRPSPDHRPGTVDAEQVDRYIAYGAYQMDRGDFENALELFDKAIELDGGAAFAYANKGTLYSKTGDDRKALECYRQALALAPDDARIYTNMAISYEALGDAAQEKLCYAAAARLAPEDLNVLFQLANCHTQDNEYREALALIDRVIELAPDPDRLYGPKLSKAGLLVEIGAEQEAYDLYLDVARRFPEEAAPHSVLPGVYYAKGRKDEAVRFFDDRRAATGDDRFLRYKADFLAPRDPDAAIRAYEAWLALRPDDVAAIEGRLALLQAAGVPIDDRAEVARILAVDPSNVRALGYQVQYQVADGQFEDALRTAERLYDQDRDNMEAVSLLIQVAEKFLPEPEILARIERLQRENPGQRYNIEFRKGLYYKSNARYPEAVAVFSALNDEHQFGWNWYQIGIILTLQGQTDAALQHLARAFSLDPALKADARQFPELDTLRSDARFRALVQ